MILDGREVQGYIKERHDRMVRSMAHLPHKPRLAIVRQGATPATDMYLRVKRRYGQDIGVEVDLYTESPETLLSRIDDLNADQSVHGINLELPLADAPEMTDEALARVALQKDIDGLAPGSPFEMATPKAIWWLLGAYNVDLNAKIIAIVGQGRLVGLPLSNQMELAGHTVKRLDIMTNDLRAELLEADIIITATGQAGLITSAMVRPKTVLIDAGAPHADLAPDLIARTDISYSPNPGGVGPLTVAALYDNLLSVVR